MSWLDLRTGYRCNNRCRFCDQGSRRDTHADAPFEALVALLEEGRAAGSRAGVWLAGGEITLRADLPRLVEAARHAGYTRVGIQTNGRILATRGAAERLRAAGLTDAIVAIHAADAALHDWLVQAQGAHAQATLGIRRLAAAGVATRINTVLTRSGVLEIAALSRLPKRLGAEGHRWILARPEGAAQTEARMLVPRLALLREPLSEALQNAWTERLDVETVGLPLCVSPEVRSAAADRLDLPAAERRFPSGMDELPAGHQYGTPCAACTLRSACRGLPTGYADRFGWDEVVPPGESRAAEPSHNVSANQSGSSASLPPPRAGRPPGTSVTWARVWRGGDPVPGASNPIDDPLLLPVEALCTIGCASCAVRDAYGAEWPTESGRALRQRVVRAASEGVRGLVFTGASPWSHPALPAAIREARRLGLTRIEVWGPIEPLATLDGPTAERLAGLIRIRAPQLQQNIPQFTEARARLAELLPSCPVELYAPSDTPLTDQLYQAAGPRAIWAPCQRTPG